ncbi:MAG: hypothetical protein M3463_02360 [Verrucomicrobiota bacterium]|nr:hypothetical protein [Verrucomicrobiota bacterium]
MADERWFVFPYAHLLVASLQREGNKELLKVCFTTHEVLVRGRNLRALALALQKFSADWIRELPPRYEGLVVPDGAFVEKIEVKESASGSDGSAEPT